MKNRTETIIEIEVDWLAKDEELLNLVKKSREDRKNGRIYNKEQGLAFIRENE
ncbi:hypothetical protein [Mesobacillus campisalis]|uniref:hypothetical protein n=1 Tax=Mesobacillus campisalis TaxID=1408103 RepID=UPI000A4A3942|nr:hypothetical protein [Mesobacillus campisalis]